MYLLVSFDYTSLSTLANSAKFTMHLAFSFYSSHIRKTISVRFSRAHAETERDFSSFFISHFCFYSHMTMKTHAHMHSGTFSYMSFARCQTICSKPIFNSMCVLLDDFYQGCPRFVVQLRLESFTVALLLYFEKFTFSTRLDHFFLHQTVLESVLGFF